MEESAPVGILAADSDLCPTSAEKKTTIIYHSVCFSCRLVWPR